MRAVQDMIDQHDMLRAGERVLVGLSGGADSAALLDVMDRLSGPRGFRLRAVHVHHGIRGTEADRDAEFAASLADRLGIPFRLLKVDVPAYAAKMHLSTEEAARELRYRAFYREAESWDLTEQGIRPSRIAVAHNRDDQAETVLFRLVRGTGLSGASGIPAVRDRIIRPLLSVPRKEIEAYLSERNISCIMDSTNLEERYTRNYLRLTVLPALKAGVNEQAGEHLAEAADRFREACTYLEALGERVLSEALLLPEDRSGEGNTEAMDAGIPRSELSAGRLRREAMVVRKYCMRAWMARMLPGLKNVTEVHVDGLAGLPDGPNRKRQSLPGGYFAELWYGRIRLYGPEERRAKKR